jgi:thiol-disulfide isomerase/thioredoxin
MMIERALFSGILLFVFLMLWYLLRNLHIRRANQALALIPSEPSQPSLLYFGSANCAPCTTQELYLNGLEEEYGRVINVRRIDTDFEPETAARYGVFTVPTTVIVDGRGNVRSINYGITGSAKLARQLEKIQ